MDYGEPRFLDVTAGLRGIYLSGEVDGLGDTVFLDIDISVRPHVCADHRMLPFRDGCFERVVFDPPFLVRPYRLEAPGTVPGRYGYYGSRAEMLRSFAAAAAEARRVLRPGGTLLMKYMPYSHWTETNLRLETVARAVEREGLVLVEKRARPPRPGNRWPVYWLTFKRA